MTSWLAKQLLGAFLAAFALGRKKGYAWMLAKADHWREHCRQYWWSYKLHTILSVEDPDDDVLADALAKLWKFETPPADSKWAMVNGVYVPGPGSGYLRTSHGEYVKVT